MDLGHHADFVKKMRSELIQKVSLVPPLADKLLQEDLISKEGYANICSKSTSQEQMRELYLHLNNKTIKSVFYEALKKEHRPLLEDLEEEYKSSGADFVNETRNELIPRDSSVPSLVDEDINEETYNNIRPKKHEGYESSGPLSSEDHRSVKYSEKWQRQSIAHRAKFENLLKDPEREELENRKLLLCLKDDYSIGDGSEGTQVYIGLRDDGTEVAVKRMLKVKYKQLKNEMELLRKLEHKNIVRYLDFTEGRDFYYLCLQLCEYNFEKYKNEKELDQEALKKLVKEMLLGLQVLHDADIIHRDIKPSNILIDVRGNVRLSDFGISRMMNQDASTVYTARAGSRGWEAAEILKADGQCAYKRSSDIQVAGMLVYYILSGGVHPFGKGYIIEENIRKGYYQLDQTTDVEAKDLIERMITPEPEDRLRVAEAVDHPYFWDNKGRDDFLRTIGDKEPVQKYDKVDETLRQALEKYSQFSGWKSKVPRGDKKEDKIPDKIPDNLLGLLRFLRNKLVHDIKKFYEKNMYKDLFPEFYVCANQLAKDMGWK